MFAFVGLCREQICSSSRCNEDRVQVHLWKVFVPGLSLACCSGPKKRDARKARSETQQSKTKLSFWQELGPKTSCECKNWELSTSDSFDGRGFGTNHANGAN